MNEEMAHIQLSSTDLSRFLREKGITAEIIHLEEETHTVAAAAAALGVQPEQIIKSVLFLADGRPILIIANGRTRIDRKQLADYLGVSRRRMKIASADQVLSMTGYQAGALPPFGHQQPIRTLVEEGVAKQDVVYGGGGDTNALMRLTTAELLRIAGADVVSLHEEG